MPGRATASRPKKELIDSLLLSGREMSSRVIFFHQTIASRFGLNPTDYKMLDIARHQEAGLTPGRLAEMTGLTTSAITAALDRLERAKFVRRERDDVDRRKVIIRVLPEAHDKFAPLFAGLAEAMRALHEKYTAPELALILDYQGACCAVLEEQAKALGGETSESDSSTGATRR
jgi:DNA-binding MarR family transcriptional regulator